MTTAMSSARAKRSMSESSCRPMSKRSASGSASLETQFFRSVVDGDAEGLDEVRTENTVDGERKARHRCDETGHVLHDILADANRRQRHERAADRGPETHERQRGSVGRNR